MKPDFYYLESDGQVFLVKRGKRWGFPRKRSEFEFDFEPVLEIPVSGHRVLFAKPVLEHHPEHWFHKDLLIGRADIDPLVQQAVNRTLVRGASKVAIIEHGKVLMVKGARGLSKGMWNLPGGFIGYGEHPEESAQREVLEEVGIQIKIVKLLGVFSNVFPRSGGYMISFVYLGTRGKEPLRPHPEEIDEICWMPIKEALRSTLNPFAKSGLSAYLKKR